VKQPSTADLVIGKILFFPLLLAIRLFFFVFWKVVALHERFPVVALGCWGFILGCFFWQEEMGWIYSLLVWAAFGAFIKYYGYKFRSWLDLRAFKKGVCEVMERTLWDEEGMKPKRYVRVSRTEMLNVYKADFFTPMGQPDKAVLDVMPVFTSGLMLSSYIHLPDENPNDGVVSLLLCRRDPLLSVLDSSKAPVLHLTEEEKRNPFHWLPIGVDAMGSGFEVPLFLEEGGSVRQMCAGASGSGKSSIIKQQLLQAILCPSIEVIIMDGKQSEFGLFEPYADKFGRSVKDFWAQLNYLKSEIDRRGKVLNQNKLTQEDRFSLSWNHIDDGPFIVWFWDELGAVLNSMKGAEKQEAYEKLYAVLSVARSLGIGAVFSSQTFKTTILPSDIRDNTFDLALSFKVNTPQEASYLGFEPGEEVNPSKIGGRMLKSGRFSTVGTFATVGLANAFGRSYYVSDRQLRHALKSAPVLHELEQQK
jgi:hypothetical protein